MRIQLAATNRHVYNLCREVFTEILWDKSTVEFVADGDPRVADLCVWDVGAEDQAIFSDIKPSDAWRHFFLVDRGRVDEFRQAMPIRGANIVLKPVTKAALMAFFAEACERSEVHRSTGDPTIESLRADRDEILQCLMEANLKLQEYDHDRTNFLARAIHDFRAPLTAVSGYCGLLLGEDIGSLTKDQREVLERMHHSARKLSRMASAMFQLSVAPRAEAVADLQHGDICECIEHAVNEILPSGEEKRLTITVDAVPCPEPLLFGKTKLEQVLLNLLENACKFTPRGGTIAVSGYPYSSDAPPTAESTDTHAPAGRVHMSGPNSYRVDIRDNGPGIPLTHLSKIFEEYTSYGGGVDRSGGGLGLAICRMIITQHKGRIWAETSKDGAVFSFILPFESKDASIADQSAGIQPVHARAF